ncbi:MAG: TetR/AcrR family transcriptional regulator [Candidatus Thorarchaeota archaeon]
MNDCSLIIMTRTRDQTKYDAIVNTSIRLVNQLGFDGISISKIAAQAKVSPATIYIYFKNREDLFTKIYTDIRNQIGQGAFDDIQDNLTIEDAFKTLCRGTFLYYLEHPDFVVYRERFEQTAMMQNVDEQGFGIYRFSNDLLQRGIKERIIKDLPIPLLASFAFVPIITLLRFHINGVLKLSERMISQVCEMAWNSIAEERNAK